MMRNWRIAIPPLLLALVMVGYSGYQAWSAKVHARRLVAYVKKCQSRAEQGDPEFEAELGGLYGRGRGVQQDDATALKWYRKAADQGFAGGEAGLGYYYHFGLGVQQSDGEALHWYQLAAQQGDPNGEDALGWAYLNGQGVAEDDIAAVHWYRKAADQGYPKAEYDLAWMERYGRGMPRNNKEALRWFRKAADQGDPEAQNMITRPMTAAKRYTYIALLLFNLWIFSEFFYDLPRFATETPRFRRQSILLLAFAALSVVLLGVTWYGYEHHRILCIGCGMNTFTACRSAFFVESVVLLFIVLRVGQRPSSKSQNV